MHGIIVATLKQFVEEGHGPAAWREALEASGKQPQTYLANRSYPDTEVLQILRNLSRKLGKSREELLQAFGEYAAPKLMQLYGMLLQPEWRTADVLEHVEDTIHKVVRVQNPGAFPPELVCRRVGPSEVEIVYTSARKMCPLARGLIHGISHRFGETAHIGEPSCMLRGDLSCRLVVRVGEG